MSLRILCRATFLACAAFTLRAAELPAQTQKADTATFCIAGRPLPSCRYFLVATGSLNARMGGSSITRTYEVRGETREFERPLMGNHYDLEIGVMANRGAGTALGAALTAGLDGDTGLRLALKARHRRWLGRSAALDAGAGVLRTPVRDRTDGFSASPVGYGVTGDLTVGLTDWVAVSGRGDLVWSEGEPVHAFYGGIRLGSLPALFTSIVVVVVAHAVAGAS